LAFLQRLRETDMPIRDMLRFARLRSEGDSTIAERRTMLQVHLLALRERMARLESAAQALDEKIGHYASLETRLGDAEAPLSADEVPLHSPAPQGADDANTSRPTPTEHSPPRRSSARRV
jgi:DNA-binding transcriptional MerR regulator